MMKKKLFPLAVFALIAGLCPPPGQSGQNPLNIHGELVKAIQVRRDTQQKEDRWAEEKPKMVSLYQRLKTERQALEKTAAALTAQIGTLATQQAEKDRQIKETARIQRDLEDRLDTIIERLAEFVEQDLPFLPVERSERIDSVRSALIRDDIGFAEKCRRVLEALKVETDYGRTVEVYSETIDISRKEKTVRASVDILRLGRISLFWRTPDESAVGGWDPAERVWVELPGRYRRPIGNAFEMALKRRPAEMVKLPLGRIVTQ